MNLNHSNTPREYQPIDCSFHDILLDRATRKKRISLVYLSSRQEKEEREAIIIDVFTKNREEFLKLDSGEMIRLDHLISVDQIPLPVDASCNIQSKKQ